MPRLPLVLAAAAAASALLAGPAAAGGSPGGIRPTAPYPPALRVDVTGDGVPDPVWSDGTTVVVLSGTTLTRATVAGRLDGAIRLRGMRSALLLIRVASGPEGESDGLYRLRGGRLERLPVLGAPHGGLATALVGNAYLDVDCGPAPRTVVQLALEPLGTRWRVTALAFALRGNRFVPVSATRRVEPGTAIRRRCPVLRR